MRKRLAVDCTLIVADVKAVVLPFLLVGGIRSLVAEELLEHRRQVGKRLLVRILVYVIDPGIAGMFDGIPLRFQLRSGRFLSAAGLHLPMREPPVVDKAGRASCLTTVRFLSFREV
jgi:hypothetical protein